jgi:hypothetical protein
MSELALLFPAMLDLLYAPEDYRNDPLRAAFEAVNLKKLCKRLSLSSLPRWR